jgi:TPP-dependent 2-oxoacid decarboxylase
MAWTVPITFTAGRTVTASMLNTYLRDNLSELAPHKATTEGSYFVGTAAHTIAERTPQRGFVSTSETTTSTSYTNLATTGPSVTCETGTSAFVFHAVQLANSLSSGLSACSWAISGDTTRAAQDSTSIIIDGAGAGQHMRMADVDFLTTLTPGTNTFTEQYKVGSGTGTFVNRAIMVFPF